jgi:RNA polymerase sigma factor (sigma-70 family)
MRLTKQTKMELNSKLEETFEAWKLDRDNVNLRNDIVMQSSALVDIVIRPFRENKTSMSYDDLKQEGFLSIINSLDKIADLGYEKGFLYKKILSYIRKQIFSCLDSSDLIKLESSLYTNLYKLKAFQKDFQEKIGRAATNAEILENTTIPKSALNTLSYYFDLSSGNKIPDILIPSFSEFGDNIALDDFNFGDESSENQSLIQQKNPLSFLLERENSHIILKEIEMLPNDERNIFLSKYGAFGVDKKSVVEISHQHKTSIPKVYAIQKKVESLLRKKVATLV